MPNSESKCKGILLGTIREKMYRIFKDLSASHKLSEKSYRGN